LLSNYWLQVEIHAVKRFPNVPREMIVRKKVPAKIFSLGTSFLTDISWKPLGTILLCKFLLRDFFPVTLSQK
jgi:hypothetical protein